MLCSGEEVAETVETTEPMVALGTGKLFAPFSAMAVEESCAKPMERGLYRKTE